jgi:hypothetical protein
MNLAGKIIQSGDIGTYGKLCFTDGSSVSMELTYEDCYYESDSPSLKVTYHPNKRGLHEAVSEIKSWFKAHPTRKSRTFNLLGRAITVNRGDDYEKLLK